MFRVVLIKTKGNKKFLQARPIFLVNHIYLLTIVFHKFDPLAATGTALCVDLGPKMSKFIPLSLRLSGINSEKLVPE